MRRVIVWILGIAAIIGAVSICISFNADMGRVREIREERRVAPTASPAPAAAPTATPTPTPTPLTYEQANRGSIRAAPGYRELLRNIEGYAGNQYRFTGEILQVQEDEAGYLLRIALGQYGSNFDAVILGALLNKTTRYLEGDVVVFIGEVCCVHTYETVLGAQKTVPLIEILAVHPEIKTR